MKEVDGDIAWAGGMDASMLPYLLTDGMYHRACNVRVEQNSGDLKNRYGFECIKLVGDEDAICIYNNAKNVQAEGYYKSGGKHILVRLIDGWIVELEPITSAVYKASIRNADDRRNEQYGKAWIATVPGGVIVNDGYDLPHIVRKDSIRRSRPTQNEIGVGRMGIYLQNRFFYVDYTGKLIRYSDFRNPVSIENSKLINLVGFLVPNDDDVITAIGNRQQLMDYVEGGSLSFSTVNDTYSVDVRGDAQNWEEGNVGLGKVQESLPGVGAVSSYSYASFASNLFFRSTESGLINLYAAQQEFNQGEQYTDHAYGLLHWFDRDDRRLLSKCYTRRFGPRMFTTVAPEINKHGYCYWAGMVSMLPTSVMTGQKARTVFEGLITGVRPWCMTSFNDGNSGSKLFVDSYDKDGQTRLYQLNIELDYDIDHRGNRVEIESWLETRSYGFEDLVLQKQVKSRAYTLLNMPRNVDITVSSKTEQTGPWAEFHSGSHYVPDAHIGKNEMSLPMLTPVNSDPQGRVNVRMPKEKDSTNISFGGLGGDRFVFRQYRFDIKGAYTMGPFLAYAKGDSPGDSVAKTESEKDQKNIRQFRKSDYNYSISHGSF